MKLFLVLSVEKGGEEGRGGEERGRKGGGRGGEREIEGGRGS